MCQRLYRLCRRAGSAEALAGTAAPQAGRGRVNRGQPPLQSVTSRDHNQDRLRGFQNKILGRVTPAILTSQGCSAIASTIKKQITNSHQIAYITEQAAEEQQQELELEQGVAIKLALRMQQLHALDRENAKTAGAILRNAWARCETCCAKFSDNGCKPIAWETQEWNFVPQLELGTSTLSCCVRKRDNPQPACK